MTLEGGVATTGGSAEEHWHNLLLFHEYFHGDNGAGIGASHQTGWTGTVARTSMFAGALRPQAVQVAD
jgi:hypothetical protein